MIIISWDVGIKHLAYCVLEYLFNDETKKVSIEILDWDEINLIEDDLIVMECCGKMKAKRKGEEGKICGKNATYYLHIGVGSNGYPKSYGFCKKHLVQHNEYWSQTNTKMLFKQIKPDHECCYPKKDGSTCGKICKYVYKNGHDKNYYCTSHYKSQLKKKIKELSPQPIKNLISSKYPTSALQLKLIQKLDERSKHFAKLGIEEVVIENQPSQKNPRMKSISNTLFDYFMIRGYVDKIHEMDIQLVRFMCPSNKLKVNNDNTIEVFKSNKDASKKYKLTKALSIQYTKQLLNDDEEQLDYLALYKKKDDICDAYLQGRYYLEFIRNKQDMPIVPKKSKAVGSGSKTAKEHKPSDKTKKLKSSKSSRSDKKNQKIITL